MHTDATMRNPNLISMNEPMTGQVADGIARGLSTLHGALYAPWADVTVVHGPGGLSVRARLKAPVADTLLLKAIALAHEYGCGLMIEDNALVVTK